MRAGAGAGPGEDADGATGVRAPRRARKEDSALYTHVGAGAALPAAALPDPRTLRGRTPPRPGAPHPRPCPCAHHSHSPKFPAPLSPSGSGLEWTGLCQVNGGPSKDAGRGGSDHSGQSGGQLICSDGLGAVEEPGVDWRPKDKPGRRPCGGQAGGAGAEVNSQDRRGGCEGAWTRQRPNAP